MERKIDCELDEHGRVALSVADLIEGLATNEASYVIDRLCAADKVMLNAVSMIVYGIWFDKDEKYWSIDADEIQKYRAIILDQLSETKEKFASQREIELDRARADAFFEGQRSAIYAIAGEENDYRQRLWDKVLAYEKMIAQKASKPEAAE